MTTRRDALKLMGGAAAANALLPAGMAFAGAATDQRLVVVVLRGGLDGLSAVPPHGDPDYARLRPNIAVPKPGTDGGAVDLDGRFGLHPALAPLAAWYRAGELLILPAGGGAYRKRSHFDAQNVLENGTGIPFGSAEGWLGRALAMLGSDQSRLGLSVGHGIPLILRGERSVQTLAPTGLPAPDDDFLARVAMLYDQDRLFRDALAAARLSAAGPAGDMARGMDRRQQGQKMQRDLTEAAGRLLAAADGPRIAVIDAKGWDTHARQANRLTPLLAGLADGLAGLRDGLGGAWGNTVVLLASEFGRTAAENGNAGTDHGYGGLMLALGGAVNGGRIAGRWPGLAPGALHQGRDLMPTVDLRAVWKAALRDHLGLPEAEIESRIFPESRPVRPLPGLVRGA